MLGMYSILHLVTQPAFAQDADGDGWDLIASTPPDCDDTVGAINPAAPEDGVDDIDEDCDGSVLVHRQYLSSMNSFVTSDFTLDTGATVLTPTPTYPDDLVHFVKGPHAKMTMDLVSNTLPFASGEFTVTLRVAAITGTPTCSIAVTSTSMATTTRNFSTTGLHTYGFPYSAGGVTPGDDITFFEVRCQSGGAGTMDLDWLTIQNGPYVWAPMNDVGVAYDTMGLPGVGRQATVRASHGASGGLGEVEFVGSDVGGLGWSIDGLEWHTANGGIGDWSGTGSYGVWDIWSVDTASPTDPTNQMVIAITGYKGDTADETTAATGGGLWYTDELDSPIQTWTRVPDPEDGAIGASKHFDNCGLSVKPIGSGALILNAPTDTTSTKFLVGSQAPDTRGIWYWDKGLTTAPVRPYFNTSLPTGELPGALALDSSGEFLLVGYRVNADDDATAGGATLFVCPSDFDAASGSDDCVLISEDTDAVWAGDVRDIESDPNTPGRFYVADGGRRWNGSSCDVADPTGVESTVYVIDVSGSSWPPTMTIADTDYGTTQAEPSWATLSSGGVDSYYSADECYDNTAFGVDVQGDLVPPMGTSAEGHEVSSIAVDPNGDWLFAFYPLNEVRRYGCVRSFRVPTIDVADGATPWLPFQGWEYQKMNFWPNGGTEDAHAADRRSFVDVTGASASQHAFMVTEPLLENWAGASTHDAAFVRHPDHKPDLLLGGNFLWRFPSFTSPGYGWDSPVPLDGSSNPHPQAFDLDEIAIELAWDGDSAVFQDATAKAIAVCPGCAQFGAGVLDLVLAAGVSDYKMARLYGLPVAAPRPAADRSCEVQQLTATGYDVSIWQGDVAHAPQAWMNYVPQSGTDDSGHARGLMYLADVTTDDWCWDGVQPPGATGGLTNSNYVTTSIGADGYYNLLCGDSSFNIVQQWDSCDNSTTDAPYPMGAAGVGVIVSLAALGDLEAVLAATPGAAPDPSTTVGGEGLWLATYTGSTGITYQSVSLSGSVTFSNSATSSPTCYSSDFFSDSGQVSIVLDPASDPGGDVSLVATSRDCGVAVVDFTVSAGAITGSWSAVDVSDCGFDPLLIRGASFSRDGRWLMVYGGPNGGVCAVDEWGSAATDWALTSTDWDAQITSVLPHPHLDDTFYVGAIPSDDGVDSPGVFVIQRRFRPSTLWSWGSRRLGGRDLQHRSVVDLDWGTGVSPLTSAMRDIYVTTAGGGFWDGRITAQ